MPTAKRNVVLVALAVVASVAVVGATVSLVAQDDTTDSGATPTLTANWVSDTGRNITGNHHVAVGGTVGDQPFVFAPISGETAGGGQSHGHRHDHANGVTNESAGCGLVALNGTSGGVRWAYEVPPANCTIHSIADPTLADIDGDGVTEVLATSTEKTVAAFDPRTGDTEFRRNLSAYGYTRPVVANFTGDARPEVVVVDVHGTVFVVRPDANSTDNDSQGVADAETVWTRKLPADYVWGQPYVEDFDGDGAPELAVALGNGRLVMLENDGSIAWNRSVGAGDSVTWFTTGQADDDPPAELVTATSGGNVSLLDGDDGELVWRQSFGAYAAVDAVGDGDGDGTAEVYATARDGNLRAIDATSGDVEWTTSLTTVNPQMTPPPVLGDVDDDGDDELVAASNDGRVSIVDPTSGEILASYERETPLWTNPTLADMDDDPAPEILTMYGDGRVAALSYENGTE
ncbi:PQQ-binding-like beta-propeller repeat protein [Halorussus sp. MSC15.2]|uniref:outer membrane protein assembly factor BamB family protein n=1 Tax=Halorussus sp. MSC15.2 TaxID=2283638 RepID=UPI0013CF8EC4|nr:PQQ-binding-like beta-propeller repeat protein [Halorussus sp. MSC15.2]NEU56466.1 PQQ-binding-like beta-propeller repeat protein [Halorussus sp. MSC15.2]